MKYLLILVTVYLSSCNNQPTLEASVKKYMTDSVVPRFNDPSSYEYVSMKTDTFTGGDYIEKIKNLYADTMIYNKETIVEKRKEVSELSSVPGFYDSVLNIQIVVNYRGKNKMGAIVLDKTKLRYSPTKNTITEIQ